MQKDSPGVTLQSSSKYHIAVHLYGAHLYRALLQAERVWGHRATEVEARALKDISNAASERDKASADLEAVRAAFDAFRVLKGREIAALELRLRHCLNRLSEGGGAWGSDQDCTDGTQDAMPSVRRWVSLLCSWYPGCCAVSEGEWVPPVHAVTWMLSRFRRSLFTNGYPG